MMQTGTWDMTASLRPFQAVQLSASTYKGQQGRYIRTTGGITTVRLDDGRLIRVTSAALQAA
jgi:hypothetical protein